MRKEQKILLILVVIAAYVAVCLFAPELVLAGDLEPSASPGSTMKTLDQIPPTWSQIIPASERFELVMDGVAVLDKETGLVWARDACASGYITWQNAIQYCRMRSLGNRLGWRLPTVEEMASLVDTTESMPALPSGHPFTNVASYLYWSITEHESDGNNAYAVCMDFWCVEPPTVKATRAVRGRYVAAIDELDIWVFNPFMQGVKT
jgi:hypothetical protein